MAIFHTMFQQSFVKVNKVLAMPSDKNLTFLKTSEGEHILSKNFNVVD